MREGRDRARIARRKKCFCAKCQDTGVCWSHIHIRIIIVKNGTFGTEPQTRNEYHFVIQIALTVEENVQWNSMVDKFIYSFACDAITINAVRGTHTRLPSPDNHSVWRSNLRYRDAEINIFFYGFSCRKLWIFNSTLFQGVLFCFLFEFNRMIFHLTATAAARSEKCVIEIDVSRAFCWFSRWILSVTDIFN